MTDRIAAAARATRKYIVSGDKIWVGLMRNDLTQTICDYHNLIAVLESDLIRKPSIEMIDAGFNAGLSDNSKTNDIWQAMLDRLITEIITLRKII